MRGKVVLCIDALEIDGVEYSPALLYLVEAIDYAHTQRLVTYIVARGMSCDEYQLFRAALLWSVLLRYLRHSEAYLYPAGSHRRQLADLLSLRSADDVPEPSKFMRVTTVAEAPEHVHVLHLKHACAQLL
jgi:hypothetical protein